MYQRAYRGGKRWNQKRWKVCLSRMDSEHVPTHPKEIWRRIKVVWKTFTTIKDVFQEKLDKDLRAKLCNIIILPAMLYSSKTWATKKKEEQRLVMAQRSMKRSALRISLHEHIRFEVIQSRVEWRDVITEKRKRKFY